MIDTEYKDAILNKIKTFTEAKITPLAAKFDREECMSMQLIKDMGKEQFLGANFPKQYGGLGLDAVSFGEFNEIIGKGCSSVRTLITVHSAIVGETLLRFGTDSQKEEWLPQMASGQKIAAFALSEPKASSNFKDISCSYTTDEDGNYIINGEKKWISFGAIADVILLIAKNENNQLTAFLVDRNLSGVSSILIKGLLGSRASHTGHIKLENVKVSPSHVVGGEGVGFYVTNYALDYGRYSVAWAGVALSQAALEEMINYAVNRKQSGEMIANHQFIKGMIANATTKIHAARLMCLNAGKLREEKSHESIIETTMAKYFSSKIANEIAADAVQVLGANGCSSDYPVERYFREAKILEIIEGTSQIQKLVIGDHAIDKYYKR